MPTGIDGRGAEASAAAANLATGPRSSKWDSEQYFDFCRVCMIKLAK